MSSKLTRIHALHRLLSLILQSKPDSCLDLLEVTGYAPRQARSSAIEILSTFFPEAIGHNAISRRAAQTTYAVQRTRWETGQEKVLGQEATEGHHFVPWRKSTQDAGYNSPGFCAECSAQIHGFCVRCTLCRDLRHLHCFSDPDGLVRYPHIARAKGKGVMAKGVDAGEGVAQPHVKFSLRIPRLDEKVLDGATSSGNSNSTRRKVGEDQLHLVNLFTVTLCDHCHTPIWGTHSQAYFSFDQQRFFHPTCVDEVVRSGPGAQLGQSSMLGQNASHSSQYAFSITLASVFSSWQPYADTLCLSSAEVFQRPYDEIAVIYGTLWTQYQLLKNGLASQSIQIAASGDATLDSDILGLRPYLRIYEEYLEANDTHASPAVTDFANISNADTILGAGYLFSERYLAYCTALLRSPSAPQTERPSSPLSPRAAFLSANGSGASPVPAPLAHVEEEVQTCYEVLPLSAVQNSIAGDMGVKNSSIASLFIDQLRLVGLISIPHVLRLDAQAPTLTSAQDASGIGGVSPTDQWCSFTLPLLMDPSPTIELLIASIESLLDDLDLTMNEIGLRLAYSRAWPSLLCSPYAMERIGAAIVKWVMAQDASLHGIVRMYASKHRRLPGVRSSAGAGAKGTSSVQVYKDDRLAIQNRYARPWLEVLHEHDPTLYAHVVYDQCRSLSGLDLPPEASTEVVAAAIAGSALEKMAVMGDERLLFSTQLDLLTSWLEDLGVLAGKVGVSSSFHLSAFLSSAPHEMRARLTSGYRLSGPTSTSTHLASPIKRDRPIGHLGVIPPHPGRGRRRPEKSLQMDARALLFRRFGAFDPPSCPCRCSRIVPFFVGF